MNPLLLPAVLAQGLWVRARTGPTSPAGGPTRGGADGGLRLAVVGESTAAGCGVATHEQGFPGALARELTTRTGRAVSWQVAGLSGATARQILPLTSRVGPDLDIVVLLAGVNDVLTRRTPTQWSADLTALLDALTPKAAQVVVAGLPPFDAFPALPGLLGRYLAEQAAALDAVSRQVCARPHVQWVSSRGIDPDAPDFFGTDKFHPGQPATPAGPRSSRLQ